MNSRLATCLLLAAVSPVGAVDFNRDIAPVLVKRCAGCHNDSEARGDLNLTTRDSLLKGGSSGTALVPGKPGESLAFQRIVSGEMPPKERGPSKKLSDSEQHLLREWIASGAAWPKGRVLNPYELTTATRGGLDWWSLRPVRRPPVPVLHGEEPNNPIDAFLLTELMKHGLTMAPKANPRTLVRRLYFDLIGLPPTPEEVEAFVQDAKPQATEELIDKLLASPQYGERWARFWLDLVRFAETNGYERDGVKPFAWKYRDYVIRAFNQDKPFDRFILEQLAGDELPGRTEETIVATSMLRVGTWDDEPNDKLEYKYDRLEDMVHVTTTAFLGLTVKCARCHDHKFDPIPQSDYYRIAAAFWAGDLDGNSGGKVLGFEALGWTDTTAKPAPLHLLKKGDPRKPGKAIEPGFLSLLPALDRPFALPRPEDRTTTRRLQLARRIVDPVNPLTARAMVNRLWQQHFGAALVRTPDNLGFKGDLPSHPELLDWLAHEFQASGERQPPEWSIKRMHKLLLTSRAWQQASVHPRQVEFAQKDSNNRYWWRMNRRRLEAEPLRDSLLWASGQLNQRMGGPGFTPRVSREALEGLSRKSADWKESPPEEQRRRAVYLFSKRSLILPLMTTFDFADTTRPCAQRDLTTVAPQALALLNNEFVHEQSAEMARRLVSEAGPDRTAQVQRAWQLAFGHSPRGAEVQAALVHLEAQERNLGKTHLALASLCHVLLNANEFIYVD